MKKIISLLFLFLSLSSCEKDDICAEETTPQLVIEFYSIINNATLKDDVDLKVKGTGAADFIVFNTSLSSTDTNRYLYTGNKITLPLKVNGTSTEYSLILNSSSSINSNEDFLNFNYVTNSVFVSRACGYKTVFQLNDSNGVIKSDTTTPEIFWIKGMSILTSNITTENEIHIKIFL